MVKYFISEKGYHCKKILIEGHLHPHLLDYYGNPILWRHHIAVALYERDSTGTHTVVIDPVLFPDRAVSVDEWEDALNASTISSIEYKNENWLSVTMGGEAICDCIYKYSRILLAKINEDVDDQMDEHLKYEGCSCSKKHSKPCDLC